MRLMRMIKRTTHADALHQAGRRAEAEARFREAEQMQAERQPDYPLLYSVQGFRYCRHPSSCVPSLPRSYPASTLLRTL